jgi:2-hydroxychromene-2-carboxylate isomerase
MSNPIQFWYDFSSPYGFLATARISEIEQQTGRAVTWHPYLMGALFKTTGRQPIINHPMIWEYAKQDVARTARKLKMDLLLPSEFPVATVGACRATYAIHETAGPDEAKRLAKALYRGYFQHNRNISVSSIILDIAEEHNFDRVTVEENMNSPQIKALLREVIQNAGDNNIFGSPFFLIDDEPFWGVDHIDDLILWGWDGSW